MGKMKSIGAIALATSIAIACGQAAAAPPMFASALGDLARSPSDATQVQHQPRPRHRPGGAHRRGGSGINPGVIIGGIIVGALVAEAIRQGRATDSAMSRCAAQYRSFDHETGTYVGFDGKVRVCPYLR